MKSSDRVCQEVRGKVCVCVCTWGLPLRRQIRVWFFFKLFLHSVSAHT